jgi:predicted esterase
VSDPHAGRPVSRAGAPPGEGRGVVIMVHGRGAAPADILGLVPELDRPDFTYLAPAAADGSWYPYGFLTDIAKNEPALSSALHRIGSLVDAAGAQGVGRERIVLLGFSQGACLAGEFASRHPGRYGGILMFSGGLIGPPGTVWDAPGSFDGTPVFLGCSDHDAHIPKDRVDESALVFGRRGADVTKRIYPGMGHVVNDDEIAFAQTLLDRLSQGQERQR